MQAPARAARTHAQTLKNDTGACSRLADRVALLLLEVGLPNSGPQPVPRLPTWVHAPWRLDDHRDGQIAVVRIDETDCQASVATKRCVHCIVGEDLRACA